MHFGGKISTESKKGKKNIIQINRTTNEFYNELINLEKNYKTYKQEEKLIYNNYLLMKKHLKNNLEKYRDVNFKLGYLEKYIKVIETISIIPIYVDNEEDAYTIFEVLNDRGLELNISDLLKNLFYKKVSSEEKEKVKKLWEEMMTKLENSKFNTTKFIRYYWISKEEFIREKYLYDAIEEKVKSFKDDELISFLNDLLKNVNYYNVLFNPNESDFRGVQNGHPIFLTLNYINYLNVKQCYPIILSLYDSYISKVINASKLRNFLEKIEKFSFLYIKSDLSPAKIEGLYSKAAIKIRKSNSKRDVEKSFNELIKELTKELGEVNFEGIFNNLVYDKEDNKKNRLVNYVLQRLELGDNTSVIVSGNTIEHIYPKGGKNIENYSSNNNLSLQDAEYDINKIGNLTLLSAEDNENLGSKEEFSEKKEIYKNSPLNITNKLNKYNEWSKKEIDERHKNLFNEFKKIFNIGNITSKT